MPTASPPAPVDIHREANAVQRQASVLTQKSLAEGFGLTVAEAMRKQQPVAASPAGRIQDQIVDERDGLLIGDATELDALGAAVRRPLLG